MEREDHEFQNSHKDNPQGYNQTGTYRKEIQDKKCIAKFFLAEKYQIGFGFDFSFNYDFGFGYWFLVFWFRF